MKTIKFICVVAASLMALGIIVSLLGFAWLVAFMCDVPFYYVFALIGCAFFLATFMLSSFLFDKDEIEISFKEDEGEDFL